jgi:type II secretory pathway component PulM
MKLLQTWQAFVSQRSAREQSGIYAAVWLMGLGLLWQVAVAPLGKPGETAMPSWRS